MDCDIHAHVEIKVRGKWHHYAHPSIDRWYDLFARMANVRNYNGIKPISEPRGLPKNISFTTRFDRKHDGVDGHSASWLSAKEVKELGEWAKEKHAEFSEPNSFYSFERHTLCYLFDNSWMIAPGNGHPKQLEDARLVFWFDN